MFTTIWEFEVPVEQRRAFAAAYGPDGAWAALFRGAAGYRETTLLQDVTRPDRFVTLDRWDSRAAYDAFRVSRHAAYAALDTQTAALVRRERHIGSLETES